MPSVKHKNLNRQTQTLLCERVTRSKNSALNHLSSVRATLLAWFQTHARTFPWRPSPSSYATVVSEFMLQQTRISTVLPYFQRWMSAFPDFTTLAHASSKEVMQQWAGLGYYTRARNLHTTAQRWLQKPPRSYVDLRTFPGIGPYTAAAIASILWNEPIAVVDGNVLRVLARMFQQSTSFLSKASAVTWAKPLAQALLDVKQPGIFNEALMEMGEQICTPTHPACSSCPLISFCQAFQHHTIEQCPQFLPPQRLQATQKRLWICIRNRLLLEPSSLVGQGDLWELPEMTPKRQACFSSLQERFRGKRVVGNTTFTEIFYQPVPLPPKTFFQSPLFSSSQFFSAKEWNTCALTNPHRKWIAQVIHPKDFSA